MSINLAYPAFPAAARISDGLVVASCNGDIRSKLGTTTREEIRVPGACRHRWLQEVQVKSSVSIGD